MDIELRTSILAIPRKRSRRLDGAALFVIFASACSGVPSSVVPPKLPAVGGQVSVFRIPKGGGPVAAYHPDTLKNPFWASRIQKSQTIVGISHETGVLFFVDGAKHLSALDLQTKNTRVGTDVIQSAVISPTGSVFAVLPDKRVLRFEAGVGTQYRQPLAQTPVYQSGSVGDRYVAIVGGKPPKLVIMSPTKVLKTEILPDGPVVSSDWADIFAAIDGKKIWMLEIQEEDSKIVTRQHRLSPSAVPTVLQFSRSGHQLYVGHEDNDIDVFDRFSPEDRPAKIRLPGIPLELRIDNSGRWLIARGKKDSAWVVDLATRQLAASVETKWGPDLPTVAGARTLLLRRKNDVIAEDLSRPNHPEIGKVAGGAKDVWLVTAWLPRNRRSQAQAAAEAAGLEQDSLLTEPDSLITEAPDRFYLQVSSSSNADLANEFVQHLISNSYPAQLIAPTKRGDPYRVVVGPYPTRDSAEVIGGKLGTPYFIITNPDIRREP